MNMAVSLVVSVLGFTAFFVMLNVKNDVQVLYAERSALLKEQKSMQEDYRVLQAEFAHLARPERLGAFAQSAGMKTLDALQILPVQANHFLGEQGGFLGR